MKRTIILFIISFYSICATAQQHISKASLNFLNAGLKLNKLLADDDKDFTYTAAAGK